MAHGMRLCATYESGYQHWENDQDYSPYAPGRNFFYDILHHLPTKAGHGRLMQFSLVADEPDAEGMLTRYDVDWRLLPDDARPIHYMEMQRSIVMMGSPDAVDSGPFCTLRGFGFAYTDPDTGEEVVRVEEIAPEGGSPVAS